MADAFEVGEHRYAGLVLHAGDEVLAAARDDEIYVAVEAFQHEADSVAIRRGDGLDGGFWQAGFLQALGQTRLDGEARQMAFRAAAQDGGVAGLETQRAGIGGDVRAALVDDADDADGNALPLDAQTVGARPIGEDGADRIG